jgi:prolyl-tRNA editing enzyme YbaK/EbsC (Cys-tRNA(Pro) deacylase)
LSIDEGEILQALPLADDFSVLLAVLPLNRGLDYQRLKQKYRTVFNPLSFEKANKIFWDCEPACYPPFGLPYGLKTILDKKIASLKYVYFIGGSRQSLVKMSLEDFQFLNADASFFDFSYLNASSTQSLPQSSGVDIHLLG